MSLPRSVLVMAEVLLMGCSVHSGLDWHRWWFFSLVIKHLSDGKKNSFQLHRPIPTTEAELKWSHDLCYCFLLLGSVLSPFHPCIHLIFATPLLFAASYVCSLIPSEAQHANSGGLCFFFFTLFFFCSPFFDMTFHAIFLDPPVKNMSVVWVIFWICK